MIGAEDVENGKPAPDGLLEDRGCHRGGQACGTSATPWTTRAAPGRRGVPFIGIARADSPRRAELVSLFAAENAVAVLDDINQLESVI